MSDEERRDQTWFDKVGSEATTEELKSVVRTFWILVISIIMMLGTIIYGVAKWIL